MACLYLSAVWPHNWSKVVIAVTAVLTINSSYGCPEVAVWSKVCYLWFYDAFEMCSAHLESMQSM